MRITCAISGIEYDVQHMPGYLTERESWHPIFDVPQKKLLSYLHKWGAHQLTEIDSYLLYLALFNSTDLIQWRVPARKHAGTKALVAQHMESLARAIGKINLVSHPSFVLHKIAVTPDNCDLMTSHFWIDNWHNSYADFTSGYREAIKHDKVVQRERSLDRLIKDPAKSVGTYGAILAEWANDAAEFPTNTITNPITKQLTTRADWWKFIIIKCCKSEKLWEIPEVHLLDCLEYCENNIDIHGSSYGHALMCALRHGVNQLNDPFGLGSVDFDIKHPGFKIIKSTDPSLQDINKAAMIAAAPTLCPREVDFPTKFQYLKAKLRWDMAQESAKEQETSQAVLENIATAQATQEESELADLVHDQEQDTLDILEIESKTHNPRRDAEDSISNDDEESNLEDEL